MGAVAEAALAAGAPVTGVIPRQLFERERPDRSRGEVRVVESMHERKALMYRLSAGFAVLPGGLGTLEELLEVATWNQLGFHRKPLVLVNRGGFFDPLLTMLDTMVDNGFLEPSDRALVQASSDVDDALRRLTEVQGEAASCAAATVLERQHGT